MKYRAAHTTSQFLMQWPWTDAFGNLSRVASFLPSNGSLVPLRNSLIRIAEDWELLGLSGSSPFQFNEEKLKRHDEQAQFYEYSLSLWDLVKEQLGTDRSGWIHSEDWDSVNKRNKYLYNMFIDTMSEEISAEEAAKRWPFLPKDA